MGLMIAAGLAAALMAGPASSARAGTRPLTAPPTFSGVSCFGGSFCLATGGFSKPGHPDIPLVEDWNGRTWRIMPLPRGYAGAITCGAATFCLAAAVVPHKNRAREVEWNGRTWQPMKSQPPSFFDIVCESPTFCLTNDPPNFPIEWNGKSWVGMPDTSGDCGGPDCVLEFLVCGSATICFDSGSFCTDDNCDGQDSFSDTWNGTAWVQGGGFIGGNEACTGRSFCMSLGPPSKALVSYDREITWHNASANLAAICRAAASCRDSSVNLACGSSHACVALMSSPGPLISLAWNGSSWRRRALVLISGHLPKLTTLSCGSPRNCVAIGSYQLTPRSFPRPIAEHWNGRVWQITKLPI